MILVLPAETLVLEMCSELGCVQRPEVNVGVFCSRSLHCLFTFIVIYCVFSAMCEYAGGHRRPLDSLELALTGGMSFFVSDRCLSEKDARLLSPWKMKLGPFFRSFISDLSVPPGCRP